MKKILLRLLGFILAVYCQESIAQTLATVRGTVTDGEGHGLEAVTISLHYAKDSSLVKAAISDKAGDFEIVLPQAGDFFCQYSIVGYEIHYSSPFELSTGKSFTMPVTKMKIAAKQLKGVTISAHKPLVQVLPGKTIFNVQGSINATGSNALELLQKSPGMQVDNNDNITMKGKPGVKVFIDGKMIQLIAEDLAAYLRSINSNDIEAIEIITSPGAAYDASGSAGIINIRLRKNQNFGTHASLTAGVIQGITPKGNGSVNVNYRNRRINAFTNASYSTGRYRTNISAPRIQKDTMYDQRLLQFNHTDNYNIKAGVDYFIDSRQTIGIINTTGYTTDDYASYGNTPIYYQPNGAYIKKLVATNAIPKKE